MKPGKDCYLLTGARVLTLLAMLLRIGAFSGLGLETEQ